VGDPGFPYADGDGSGIGASAWLQRQTRADAAASARASTTAREASAASAAARQARRRRGRRKQEGDAVEYMDLDVAPEWESGASDSGAGPRGFTGAVSRAGTTPVGLTAVSGDGARAPMLPSTWNPDENR
jgi:hypothetical protein